MASLGHDRRGALALAWALAIGVTLVLSGCRSPQSHRHEADRVASGIIEQKQLELLGRSEVLEVEPPADALRRRLLLDQALPHIAGASRGTGDIEPIDRWPDAAYLQGRRAPEGLPPLADPVVLSLSEALQVAAANSRDYQVAKESVYRTALALDLERHFFRLTFSGLMETLFRVDRRGDSTVSGVEYRDNFGFVRRFQSGVTLTSFIALDLVKLLTQDRASSRGVFADATISVPLLRGAGRHIVAEPLVQAERDALYAIAEFERFKQQFAVRIAADYLSVLRQLDQVQNAEGNYRRLIVVSRRARRYADEDRLSELAVDQALQDELRARSRWISARENYARTLDGFKVSLGLPTDARIELDREELDGITAMLSGLMAQVEEQGHSQQSSERLSVPADAPIELVPPQFGDGGPLEMDVEEATRLALDHRLDLWVALEAVEDAQRRVMVAADGFLPELTLFGSARMGESRSLGSAGLPDGRLRPHRGVYDALLLLDLPMDRVAERNIYRLRLLELEQSVRNLQSTEDGVKLDIRNNLRTLLESREELRIQAQAVALAERRVRGTDMELDLGRAEIRDVLEAQEALVSAQNALTAALVTYRVAELAMQRDLGLLEVSNDGLWREYAPGRADHDDDLGE